MQTRGLSGSALAMLLALSVLWAGSFVFYKVLATELPPFTTVFGRVAIGTVSLGLALRLSGIRLAIPRAKWGRFLMLGLLNNAIPFTLFAWAEQRVSSGTAAILNAMTPVFTLLVAGLILRSERLSAGRIAGIAFGFAGVAILVGPDALLGQDILGQGACLLAAISYGFGVPYGRTITGVAPGLVALGQMVASTVLLIPLVLVLDHPWALPNLSSVGWLSLLGLGVLSTGVAYVLFFQILARAGATNLSLVTLLIPVMSLVLGALLLDEHVTVQAIAGMAMIAAGFAAIDGRLAGWLARMFVRTRRLRPGPG